MIAASAKQPLLGSVRIEAPARLHLGFLDLNGGLGRRFGSLGLTLEGIATELKLVPAKTLKVFGPAPTSSRVLGYAASLIEKLDLAKGLEIEVLRATPDHVGLGSGTQLALAIASGLSHLYGLGLGTREIAALTQRGLRSGIGIGAFDTGGFLLDGGRGELNEPPPVILHSDFPQEWRILLIFDRTGSGIHGKREVSAFQSLLPFPADSAAALCRLVLMQALPALAERDCERFGKAIGRLQQVVGDYFAPAQSGRFASPEVAGVLGWLQAQGISGIGQSSWGPTGFAILDGEDSARQVLRDLRDRFGSRPSLKFDITSARNRGSCIDARTDRASKVAMRAAI